MSPRVDPPARDREAAQPFTVRRATALDAAALTELRAELFAALGREQESGANARFRERSTAALNEGLSAGFCYAWLALSPEGGPVGSAALLLFPRLPTPELPGLREGYLVSVYTAPAWRRRGVAAAMVEAAVAMGRQLGLSRVRLHATAEGAAVYEMAGFVPKSGEMELRLE